MVDTWRSCEVRAEQDFRPQLDQCLRLVALRASASRLASMSMAATKTGRNACTRGLRGKCLSFDFDSACEYFCEHLVILLLASTTLLKYFFPVLSNSFDMPLSRTYSFSLLGCNGSHNTVQHPFLPNSLESNDRLLADVNIHRRTEVAIRAPSVSNLSAIPSAICPHFQPTPATLSTGPTRQTTPSIPYLHFRSIPVAPAGQAGGSRMPGLSTPASIDSVGIDPILISMKRKDVCIQPRWPSPPHKPLQGSKTTKCPFVLGCAVPCRSSPLAPHRRAVPCHPRFPHSKAEPNLYHKALLACIKANRDSRCCLRFMRKRSISSGNEEDKENIRVFNVSSSIPCAHVLMC